MPSKTQGYTPIQSENADIEEDEQYRQAQAHETWPSATYNINILLLIALFVSVTKNLVLSLLHWPLKDVSAHTDHATLYAGMNRKVPVPYTLGTPYTVEDDRQRADDLWASINIDAGVVALSDSFVSAKGLPEAMRFPWDHTRGIYFVNAYHNLHCLKKIYRALNEYDRGIKQSGAFPHVIHCLDALRQDVLCSADDTPRYAVLKKETPTGGGQYRQCRDWSELEAWAEENTACWRYVNNTDPNVNQLERFKYCPEGSPYLEKARGTFPDAGLDAW